VDCTDIRFEPLAPGAGSHTEPIARSACFGVLGLTCLAGVVATIICCRAMPAMGEVPMPGGWALSAIWMPMCGQTWLGAGASFVASWAMMMTPMMLPSSAPGMKAFWTQARWAQSPQGALRLTALAALCYFLAWALTGVCVFAAGATLAATLMRSTALAQAAPVASGAAIVLAGAIQFTRWKARRILGCRSAPLPRSAAAGAARAACLHGLRLAHHSGCSCANLMLALLVFGVMDWRAMAAATLAMSAEALAPAPMRTAKAIGVSMIAVGLARSLLT
jgi:predicted metal-binding membrane protein